MLTTNDKQPPQPLRSEERYSGIVDPDVQKYLDAQRASEVKRKEP